MDVRSSSWARSSEPSAAPHNSTRIYAPLDKSKSEIRLLTLSAQQNELNSTAELHASIETFSLDSGNIPAYQALSYEWNPPSSPATTVALILDGKEKHVSLNLCFALFSLGERTSWNGRFWVDALCINQEDTAERSHQVQLMRQIYAKALCVHVWLGIRWTLKTGKWAASLLMKYGTPALEPVHQTLSHLRDDENYHDHREAINSVFSQSYWSRSWIIQELVSSKAALLLLVEDLDTFDHIFLDKVMLFLQPGPKELSSNIRPTNSAANRSCREKVDEKAVRDRMNARRAAEAISRTKEKLNSKSPGDQNDLLSLLARFCGQLATDPRDKICSLLGITKPNSDHSIRVDYTLTWTEVLRDAAIYAIRDRNDLEVLIYAGSTATELPSWVPDWLDQERQGTTRFPHDTFCLLERCCSPHTAKTPLHTERAGHRLPVISADGALLTISAGLFSIQSCFKVDSPEVDMQIREIWGPLGKLGDMMFTTWCANLAIINIDDLELPAGAALTHFICLWWHAIFYFYPIASIILSVSEFAQYITSSGRHGLTERQGELLHRALDEQLPFLTKVPPSVGSAILRGNIIKLYDAETLAKQILDREASVYIPGMCFWSPECGTLGPHHVLASIPLCKFPIILSKPEGSGTGYKVTTSARVANLEHGQIEQDDGTTFELPVQEIDLV